MVQGKTKNLQKSTGNSRAAKKAAANPKKGKRAIAPKKEALVKQAKMHQVRHNQHKPYMFNNRLRDYYMSPELERKDQQDHRAAGRERCELRKADYHEEHRQ